MKNPPEEKVVYCRHGLLHKQLSVVNTIHIQMRVTKFGTETSTRPPPGLPASQIKKEREREKRKKALSLLLS